MFSCFLKGSTILNNRTRVKTKRQLHPGNSLIENSPGAAGTNALHLSRAIGNQSYAPYAAVEERPRVRRRLYSTGTEEPSERRTRVAFGPFVEESGARQTDSALVFS